MEIWVFIFIMFFHWLADFVFQSGKMATNKSKSIKWLTLHVTVYSFIMMIGIFILTMDITVSLFMSLGLIFVTHWITDFITSKITSNFWNKKKVHNFFVIIGLDQWLHIVQLVLIFHLFFKGF